MYAFDRLPTMTPSQHNSVRIGGRRVITTTATPLTTKLLTYPDTLTSTSHESTILTRLMTQSRNFAPVRSATLELPEGSRSIGECLEAVMKEECEHHRCAVRDLAVLESS